MKFKDVMPVLNGVKIIQDADGNIVSSKDVMDCEVLSINESRGNLVVTVRTKDVDYYSFMYGDTVVIHCKDGGEIRAHIESHNLCDRDAVAIVYRPAGADEDVDIATFESYDGKKSLYVWADPASEDFTDKFVYEDKAIIEAL